jgi:beta-lactamase superfamily II metal-dependent hydrolase
MRAGLAVLAYLAALFLSQPSFAELRVVVMDVGQGQAVLLRRGSRGILIDSGLAPFADKLLQRIAAQGSTAWIISSSAISIPIMRAGIFVSASATPRPW